MADDAWDERLPSDPTVWSTLFPECTSKHHPLVDDLALVAVGERLTPDLEQHILECPPCLHAASAWVELADLAAFGNSTAAVPPPGGGVWAAIGTELDLTPSGPGPGGPALGSGPPTDPVDVGSSATGRAAPADPVSGASVAGAEATVVPLSSRRPARRWLVPAAAAAAGVALAIGAAVVGQQPDVGELRAVADLTIVPGGPATSGSRGAAELMATPQAQMVRVSVDDLPAGANSYEVWLFDGTGAMISLGFLRDGQGVFAVPAGVDVSTFNTVDVSDEPGDGNPAHSGVSVVRGTFV